MDELYRGIRRSQTSSRAFLLSRSELGEPLHPWGVEPEADAAWTIEKLSGVFPDLVKPGSLMEAVRLRLGAVARFSVMAVRIDDFKLAGEPEAILLDAAGIADRTCRRRNGFWGLCGKDMLACFMPGTSGDSCLAIADRMREKLTEIHRGTITIGIAEYPTLDYGRADVLVNAQKALEHAEFFGPGSCAAFDSVSLNISGDKYYQAGDIDGAIAEFKRALQLDPENVNVQNSLGVCYGVREEFDKALECFENAVQLDPAEVMAVYNAGYVWMCRGDYDKALEYFRRAGQIDATVFEVAFQTGRVYLLTRRPEKARKYLEAAIERNDRSGAAFRYLGDCYLQLDRDTDAASAYKTALKLRPGDAEALSSLGFLYEMQGKNQDIALLFCRRAVEMNPGNGLFHHRLGRVYYHRNRFEEALQAFRAAHACGHENSLEYIRLIRDATATGGRGELPGDTNCGTP